MMSRLTQVPVTMVALVALVALIIGDSSAAQAQAPPAGSAFTYQGQLLDGGVPANGLHDFVFQVFSKPTGDTPGDTPLGGIKFFIFGKYSGIFLECRHMRENAAYVFL